MDAFINTLHALTRWEVDDYSQVPAWRANLYLPKTTRDKSPLVIVVSLSGAKRYVFKVGSYVSGLRARHFHTPTAAMKAAVQWLLQSSKEQRIHLVRSTYDALKSLTPEQKLAVSRHFEQQTAQLAMELKMGLAPWPWSDYPRP